jgi:hypothetical protein
VLPIQTFKQIPKPTEALIAARTIKGIVSPLFRGAFDVGGSGRFSERGVAMIYSLSEMEAAPLEANESHRLSSLSGKGQTPYRHQIGSKPGLPKVLIGVRFGSDFFLSTLPRLVINRSFGGPAALFSL